MSVQSQMFVLTSASQLKSKEFFKKTVNSFKIHYFRILTIFKATVTLKYGQDSNEGNLVGWKAN